MALMEKRELEIIRELAKKQAEIANSEEMKKKEKLWYDHNDCKTFEPVVTLEQWTFRKEFEDVLKPQCTTEFARNLESYFRNNMVQYEYIHDDTVMPREYALGIGTWIKPFNIDVKVEKRINYAFKLIHEIKDLEADFGKLQKSPFGCDYKGVLNRKAQLEEVLDGIMPVRLTYTPGCSLSQQIFRLMGLETMMMSMIEYPELFHKMMAQISDEYVALWDFMEENKYVQPNNFNTCIPQGTYGFSTILPRNSENYTFGDVWGYMDSQETSVISPDMYHEFFYPYYKKISERFGLFSYGCCESVSLIWEKSVSNYANLRKVSISPWCDEEKIGDYLRGKQIIYHRKPHPNYIGVDTVFDKKAFSEHIKKTLNAAKGCYLEFSYRDVYSLQGELYRGRDAYDTIKDCIEKYW